MKSDLPLNSLHDPLPDDMREATEACRPSRFDPEGNDWRLPEVAPLANEILQNPQWRRWRLHIAQSDAAIAAAMDRIAVPEGLAERLLERLNRATADRAHEPLENAPSGAVELQREPAIALPATPLRPARHFGRRNRWLAVAAAAAAMLLAFGWWRHLHPAGSLGYDQLIARANAFDQSWTPGRWRSLRKAPPRAWYALPGAVPARSARGWQKVGGFLGRTGVAYKLASATGVKGALYVVPLNAVGAKAVARLASAPGNPHHTAGRAVSAWTDGQRLFVLVVRGGERDFWSLIKHPSFA